MCVTLRLTENVCSHYVLVLQNESAAAPSLHFCPPHWQWLPQAVSIHLIHLSTCWQKKTPKDHLMNMKSKCRAKSRQVSSFSEHECHATLLPRKFEVALACNKKGACRRKQTPTCNRPGLYLPNQSKCAVQQKARSPSSTLPHRSLRIIINMHRMSKSYKLPKL
jgi:hypothetical protein